ncbi:MAG: ABC transporter permease [Lentisphaeria bacterium]|nr:ABC transporter permease [Candidatus Neomarinimicrobiota bacterium]MCF7842993.1 ABC transporter permease [Lentisphaeria bacterium]
MNKIIIIAWHEFKIRVRSKWFLISTFGLPLLIIGISLLSGYIAGAGLGLSEKHYGIIDETGEYGRAISQKLEKRYTSDGVPQYRFTVENKPSQEIKSAFETLVGDGNMDGYFIIPAHIADSMEVSFYSKQVGSFRDVSRFENALNDILLMQRVEVYGLDSSLVDVLKARVNVSSYELGKEDKLSGGQEFFRYMMPFAFLFLLFMGVFMGAQLLMRGIIEERSNRVIEMMLSVAHYNELMAGKIIGLAGLGISQSLLYLIVLAGVGTYYGINVIDSVMIILFLVYFILGYLWWAAVFMAIGSLFDSEQDAQQAVGFISILAVIPIMLWTLVIESPNSTLVNVLSYIPIFTPYFMIMKLAVSAASPFQVGITLIIMVVAVYYTMRIAGKVFRTAILLYGKRITLPEILRWIRT